MKNIVYILVATFFFLSLGCEEETFSPDYQYTTPHQLLDGWEVASLDDVSLNKQTIAEMMDLINSTTGHNIHNVLIIKDGKLVLDEYFDGYAYNSSAPNSNGEYITYNSSIDHFMASITKSVTSTLVGIAIYKGFINSVDDKIIDYFPEYADILVGEKANLTIKHLLTMTSGLPFDENTYPYGDPRNELTQLINAEDPVQFVLSKDLTTTPGSTFFYNSGTTNVLGALMERATGMALINFSNDYLFTPLNWEGGIWEAFSSGLLFASGGIHAKPREMLKMGYLFLNNGKWKSNQIISPDWVNQAQQVYISTPSWPNSDSYGYQWWIKDFNISGNTYNCFYAAGWGDQYMYVFPNENMIVEFNCGNFSNSAIISPFDLVNDYILKALN